VLEFAAVSRSRLDTDTMRYFGTVLVGCLWGVSAHTNAETFLNDSTLLQQEPEYIQIAEPEVKGIRQGGDDESVIVIQSRLGYSSAAELSAPLNQGFTPSHEVMREVEEKREANDRLWQSIFSLF